MANADSNEEWKVTGYTLLLSPEEAQVLADVLSNIGGSPGRTRRKHTKAVQEALAAVGVKNVSPFGPRDFTGLLEFHEKNVFDDPLITYTYVNNWGRVHDGASQ